MVQTRSASGIDVPPPPTPSRARSVGASAPSTRKRKATPAPVPEDSKESVKMVVSSTTAAVPPMSSSYFHTPSTLTLSWLAASLPLVAWDTAYVLLRPHTMPGGDWHWPLFQPYALYGEVDHVYGRKQWEAGNGFTGAQGSLNLVETLLYVAYLWQVRTLQKTSPSASKTSARAVLLLFTAAVMTLSKTVLYWLNEAFSGFDNIRQNDTMALVTMWIIPNGLWIIFPAIIAWSSGNEIVRALAGTSKTQKK